MFLAGPLASYSNERHIRVGTRWNQVCLVVARMDNMEGAAYKSGHDVHAL